MAIGVVLTGIVAGIFAVIGALTVGWPVWVAAVLYPAVGTIGALGFVGAVGNMKGLRLPGLPQARTNQPAR